MVLRVVAKNMEESINERFKYFTEKIVPQFIGDNMDHTLIFVPNYLEYVKVRNWFKASDRDFCEISEYRYAFYLPPQFILIIVQQKEQSGKSTRRVLPQREAFHALHRASTLL